MNQTDRIKLARRYLGASLAWIAGDMNVCGRCGTCDSCQLHGVIVEWLSDASDIVAGASSVDAQTGLVQPIQTGSDAGRTADSTVAIDDGINPNCPIGVRWQHNVRLKIGPHKYVGTGKSRNTCKITGGGQWCGLPREHLIHHCRIDGCNEGFTSTVWYGLEYGPFRICRAGHTTPKPPPVDLAAIDACDEYD